MARRPENAVARGIFPRAASGTRMLPPVAPARHVLPLADALCARPAAYGAQAAAHRFASAYRESGPIVRRPGSISGGSGLLDSCRATQGRTRPSGKSSPVSSKRTTPLHSRLHPCSGLRTTQSASARSGQSAGGHGGRCGHMSWLGVPARIRFTVVSLAGRRVALRLMLESGLTGDCSGSHDRPPLWASPEGAQRRGSSGGRTPP